MNIADYLEKSTRCTCGRVHSVEMETVEIGAGTLEKVPDLIKSDNYQKPFLVFDANTYRVAGKRLTELLRENQISYASHTLDGSEPVPNEDSIGGMLIDFDPSCDLIIGVGSGTINDLSRFLSYQLGLQYYVVATAPSMDGYASTGAALIRDNLKTTFNCHMPKAIIADLDIIASAPKKMIAAGFGDVIGKYTCLADWKLSAIINQEYYCDEVVQMTRESLERTISVKDGIAKGEGAAIKELMEALVLAGIAMSYVGNSRPASGSEHHLSHFWEMRFLLEETAPVLHGTKVGIATVLVAKLYQFLQSEPLLPQAISEITPPDTSTWSQEVEQVYLAAATGVIRLEEKEQKNSSVEHQKRIQAVADHWTEIKEVLDTLPKPEQVINLLDSVNAAVSPDQIGIDQKLVHEAILYSKEIRPRYTVVQLLWDLDLLEDYARRLVTSDRECGVS